MMRIFSMSTPRKKVIDRLYSLSDEVNNHIIECVVYKGTKTARIVHWADEIAAWLNFANRQNSNIPLKRQDYINSIFAGFGEDREDAELNLIYYQKMNRRSQEYPDFEITEEMIDELSRVYRRFLGVALPMLTSKKQYLKSEWKTSILEKILE